MQESLLKRISEELALPVGKVKATAELLDSGATVPFLARYRKEATGGLDEVAIISIRDRLEKLRELEKRRKAILASLEEQGKLTAELKAAVLSAPTLAVLEDIYLPYRPKRRTRAVIAREKGLEPLARLIFDQQGTVDPEGEAERFLDPEKGVSTVEEALSGARDIIAEWANENAEARSDLRTLYEKKAILKSHIASGKEKEAAKYKDYFEWEEPLARAPSHRLLAVMRGAREGFLVLRIAPEKEEAVSLLERRFVRGPGPGAEQVRLAIRDAYQRLLAPSMETEFRTRAKERADTEAISVFTANLKELLLSPPLGEKRVLAVDPGLRTGCKIVCLSAQGKLLANETIFPLKPFEKTEEAARIIRRLCDEYDIEAIAVGNGTGGRETFAFLRGTDLGGKIPIVMVNESGASIYSASEIAREELPDQDVTVRGAVSIGRRLMDPLAELVKIDPKSIGVGQYQHDVDQRALKRALDDTVTSCVNAVGVELNTASRRLLGYVSGLGPKLAGAIVAHREAEGPFRCRRDLMRVPGLGARTFEQAAGFLRIRDGEHPLDRSAVHPERYELVERMAADLGCTVKDLLERPDLREKIDPARYVDDSVGMPTLLDIMNELAKPGRDPRRKFEEVAFADGVTDISHVKPGMRLQGVVTNVTAFGAFVDIGVHNDGLVHISELADRFVKDPSEVVRVNQKVTVTVLNVDLERGRIALSMRSQPASPRPPAHKRAPAPSPRKERPNRKPKRSNPFDRFFDSLEDRKRRS